MIFRTYIVLAASLISGIALIALSSGTAIRSTETKPTLIPPEHLNFFVLGYQEPVADLLWIRAIQDFDFCESKPAPNSTPDQYRCEKGWVFHMIQAITELAPRFKIAHLTGATMLSVLVNDIDGASIVFDKSVLRFPDDGQLAFRAAYHALIEEKNVEKASRLLIVAGKNGLPPWTFALAGRLQAKAGQLELAKKTLEDALSTNPNGAGVERIQQRLDDVNAELEKQKSK